MQLIPQALGGHLSAGQIPGPNRILSYQAQIGKEAVENLLTARLSEKSSHGRPTTAARLTTPIPTSSISQPRNLAAPDFTMSKSDDISEAGSSPSPDTAETINARKRKTNLEEIEVDVNLPEPPSKKARRALKKGKPVSTKSAGGDKKNDDDDDTKEDKTKARSEHGVWIGNMPFDVSPTELRRWLVANSGGVILEDSITRLKLPLNHDRMRAKPMGEVEKPVNKGFAYVDFDGIGPQMAAMALSENMLGSRKVLIKSSTSFEGRPKLAKAEEAAEGEGEQAAEQKKVKMNQKVFVGNLGFDTSEDDLWAHFEKCGGIDWVKIATFEDSGKCKGYGWIRFKTPEAAAWAAKGFVKIKEVIETEEDFQDKEQEEGGEEKETEKKYKTRKWWVNKLRGRDLKIEMAEDDQSRYRKRFKKDGKGGKGRPGRDAQGGADAYVQDAVKSAMAAESAAA